MPICYVVGGLGESTFVTDTIPRRLVWIALDVLMLGHVGEMRLAPDGVSPGPPDGLPLLVGGTVEPYTGFPAEVLALQLIPRGWAVTLHPWDWRKSIYPEGQRLAQRIRDEVTMADPCTIVGHSAGGLVARAAWTDLGTTGQTGLVRRIITLGTPHWGSYTVVAFWSGSNQTIDLCAHMNQVIGYNSYGFAPALFDYKYLQPADYSRLAITWPALYDILPVIGAPGSEDDPNRPALYDAANWPADVRPQQQWLDYAKNVTGPWLRSAASQPPPNVLTCVTGNGEFSPSVLVDVSRLGSVAALGGSIRSDGAVNIEDGEIPGSRIWRYQLTHENFLPVLANNGDLVGMILEERAPPPPPPPPQTVVAQQPNLLGPLPFPDRPFLGADSSCLLGNCPC